MTPDLHVCRCQPSYQTVRWSVTSNCNKYFCSWNIFQFSSIVSYRWIEEFFSFLLDGDLICCQKLTMALLRVVIIISRNIYRKSTFSSLLVHPVTICDGCVVYRWYLRHVCDDQRVTRLETRPGLRLGWHWTQVTTLSLSLQHHTGRVSSPLVLAYFLRFHRPAPACSLVCWANKWNLNIERGGHAQDRQ